MNRPEPPQPAQFGLTEAEVREVEIHLGGLFKALREMGKGPSWWIYLKQVGHIVLIVLLVAFFRVMYRETGSVLRALIAAIIVLVGIFIILTILHVLDVFICRFLNKHPKQGQYSQYLAAIKRYEAEMVAYERWQQEERRRQEEARRKQEEERRKQEGFWLGLDGWQFERELAEVFRRLGYQVTEIGGSGDQGIDLTLTKGTEQIAVQCKAHKKPIGVPVILHFYGAIMHAGIAHGILASTGGSQTQQEMLLEVS